MSLSIVEILALVLIAIGAVINFLVPPIIKKNSPPTRRCYKERILCHWLKTR